MSCQAEVKPIFIKIGRWGGKVTEYVVPMGINFIQLCNQFNIVIGPDEYPMCGGQPFVRDSIVSNSGTIMIVKKQPMCVCRIAKLGQMLMKIECAATDTVSMLVQKAGLRVAPNEDVWIHRDAVVNGILANNITNLRVEDGNIYVIEAKKNLRSKVLAIISDETEDINGSWDYATDRICEMLRIDYKIQ